MNSQAKAANGRNDFYGCSTEAEDDDDDGDDDDGFEPQLGPEFVPRTGIDFVPNRIDCSGSLVIFHFPESGDRVSLQLFGQ